MAPSDPDPPPVLIPVLLRRNEGPIPLSPERPTAYVIGRNGAFLATRTTAFEAAVPAAEVPSLAPVDPYARYLLPPMPPLLTARIFRFFLEILRRFRSEAIVLVFHHPTEGFRIEAPEQAATPASCRYGAPPRVPEGFRPIGTVHSHGHLPAFHSGTDIHDEISHDGVHATFGALSETSFEVSVELVVSGHRFPLDPLLVFGGIERRPDPPAPEVHPASAHTPGRLPAGKRSLLATTSSRRPPRPARNRYQLATDAEDASVPEAWLAQVRGGLGPVAPEDVDGHEGTRYEPPKTLEELLKLDFEAAPENPPTDPKDPTCT